MNKTALTSILCTFLVVGGVWAAKKSLPKYVGFLQSEDLIAAHAKYASVKKLRDDSTKKLDTLLAKIKALEAKAKSNKATKADQSNYQVLIKEYQDARKDAAKAIQDAQKPILKDIDGKISTYAKKNGYSIVFDKKVAATLVIYGDDRANLTKPLVAIIKKKK